jgi:hypothetical protein
MRRVQLATCATLQRLQNFRLQGGGYITKIASVASNHHCNQIFCGTPQHCERRFTQLDAFDLRTALISTQNNKDYAINRRHVSTAWCSC